VKGATGPVLAFLAACAFAVGALLQQKGTVDTSSPSGDSHWLNGHLVPAMVGLAVGVVGIVVLARAQRPASLEPVRAGRVPSPAPAS
jgi:hypothetical protein